MPGVVGPLTSDELAKLEVFPYPKSGRIRLTQAEPDRYILNCNNVSVEDVRQLEAFHQRMKGNFLQFRFEIKTAFFPALPL